MIAKLDADDLEHLVNGVEAFVEGQIRPACRRPEQPMSEAALEQLTQEATALGILPVAATEAGVGLWEDCTTDIGMTFNIAVLRLVGRACSGLAFAWHRQALARLVERRLGPDPAEAVQAFPTIVPVGHYGLARGSLGRWMGGRSFDRDDRQLLADWLDRQGRATVILAPEGWGRVIWPVWTGDALGWQVLERGEMQAIPQQPQHGFDELRAFRAMADIGSGTVLQPDEDTARQLFREVLALDMLGLLAIGLGTLEHGFSLARDYAALRRQGGVAIQRHPAVKQLLGDVETVLGQTRLALRALSGPIETIDIGLLAAARKNLHPALCLGANQVVQVFGGSGYMRDTGPEKLLRDINMLRLETGGVREIDLFLDGLRGEEQ